jgi:hypothetical protein
MSSSRVIFLNEFHPSLKLSTMNKALLPSIIIGLSLVVSATLLSRSISQLAVAAGSPKTIQLDSNGRKVEVTLGGYVGFSDSLNPLKIAPQK